MRNEMMVSITRMLNGSFKPRILPSYEIYRRLLEINKKLDKDMSRATYYRHMETLVKMGFLAKISKDIYVNLMAVPKVMSNEIAEHIAKGSVITLHSSLNHNGALNNPTRVVTAVIPTTPQGWRGGDKLSGRVEPFGDFWFFRMPEHLVNLKDLDVSDYRVLDVSYQMATPEKALMDWLYMASSPRIKNNEGYPPLDIDLGKLDKHRLARLAKAMHLEIAYLEWLHSKKEYDDSPNVASNMSLAMGF